MSKTEEKTCRGNLKKLPIKTGEDDKEVVVATYNQKAFWEYIAQGKSKKEAYLLAYPNSDPKYASQYANKLWNKDKFEKVRSEITDTLWEQYKEDAKEAYVEQKRIMRNPATSKKIKNDIANKIQDRAGYSPVQKSMSVSKTMNKDVDEMPIKQLIEESKKNLREIQNVTKKIAKIESGESSDNNEVKQEAD